jgi:competence protein ComEA
MKPFSRPQTATVILLSFLLLSFYGWGHYSSQPQQAQSAQLVPMGILIQVSGKVRSPGIYSFDHPVTVSQVVARAGGILSHLRPDAATDWKRLQIDHARRVYIQADANGVARLRLGWMSVPRRIVLGVPVDVNLASEAELALVPGITPVLAEGVVARRQSLGGFSKLEELRTVKGIGAVTLKRLRQYLTVGPKN